MAERFSQREIILRKCAYLVDIMKRAACRVLDTQLLMDEREAVDDFLAIVTSIVKKHPELKLTVLNSTLTELENQRNTKTALVELALKRLEQLTVNKVAELRFGINRGFNDASILASVLENPRQKMIFFTADKNLAADLMNMDKLQSVECVAPEVYIIDNSGFPVKRIATPASAPEPNPNSHLARPDRRSTVRGRGGCGSYGYFTYTPAEDAVVLPDQPIAAKQVGAGDMVYTRRGGRIVLEPFGEDGSGEGNEAVLYAVKGDDSRVVKIMKQPSDRKRRKVELLADRNFTIEGAAFPEEAVYDEAGNFLGCTMKKVSGISLETLLNNGCEGFTRKQYIEIAALVAETAAAILSKGIMVCDVSPSNILVDVDSDGKVLDVQLIDLDSAQLGAPNADVIPADGITPDYTSPTLIKGWNNDMLIAETEIRFSWASLLTTVMMTGIHPFQIMDETGDKTLNDCIADQKLPFGSKNQRSQAKTSRFARNLWSNMPRFVKTVLWDALTIEPNKRCSLDKLANTARAYLHWLHNEAEQFPEADSLEPQLLKPMYVVGVCGHQFDLANEGGYSTKNDEGEEVYICPECAAQPVIAQCGHELPMTKKEVFLGIKTAFKMCPDCFRKKQGWNPASAPVEQPVQPAPEPVQPAPKPVQPAPKKPAAKKPAAKPSMMPEQPPIKQGESDNIIFDTIQMLIRQSNALAKEFIDFLNSL